MTRPKVHASRDEGAQQPTRQNARKAHEKPREHDAGTDRFWELTLAAKGSNAETAGALFLDTNIWLDYFLAGRPGHDAAFRLIDTALRQNRKLLYAIASAKDVCYLLELDEKRAIRAATTHPTEAQFAAARHMAQACVDQMSTIATGIGSSPNDVRMAMHLLSAHDDFEDCLLLAAALRAQPCTLVTSDKALLAHSPAPAKTPEELL